MTRIEDLTGLPPGGTPRTIVLRHYKLIADARVRGWRWRQIAEALGLSEPAIKKAFARVKRQVEIGRIDPEKLKEPPPAKPRRPQASQGTTRPQAETHNAQTLREMGVQMIGEDS